MHTAYPSAVGMPSAPTEVERAAILRKYDILDSDAERAFDDLTALASQICGTPASIITFIDGDRLWFKSTYGLTATEAPVEHSFCAHAAGEPDEVFAIGNALADERFLQNVFVMPEDGLRAYAGANIVGPEGIPLGSICVVDFEVREFTEAQHAALNALSRQVVDQLELRRRVAELAHQKAILEVTNQHFERFAHVISHDLRGPLLKQQAVTAVLVEDLGPSLTDELHQLLRRLDAGAEQSLEMLESMMRYLQEGNDANAAVERVELAAVFRDLEARFDDLGTTRLTFDTEVDYVHTRPVVLEHILLNLVGNAVKFVDRPDGQVRVEAAYLGEQVAISVVDNGPGIPASERDGLFRLFQRGANAAGTEGTGLGLAMAQRLALSIGGQLELCEDAADADGTTGCHFILKLPA